MSTTEPASTEDGRDASEVGPNAVEPTLVSTGERFGWLYASLWLVFLCLPVGYLVTGDEPLIEKLTGVGAALVFAVIYITANRRLDGLTERAAIGYLLALTVAALASTPIFGVDALAFAPYLCAWAMLALPPSWGITVTVGSIAVSIALAITIDSRALSYSFIIGSVAIATAGVASFVRSGRQVNELRLRRGLASDQERIARDVHDVLGHSLTAVVVKSELAQRLMLTDPDRAQREVADIEALSRAALAEIRATVDGLRSTRFADEIEAARKLMMTSGIELDVPDDVDDVDPGASVMLAWAVREATTNIVRHSGARSATIRWGSDWVEISDDGRGMDTSRGDAAQSGRRGAGLTGLRERVVAMGGSLVVTTGPGGLGTMVRATARTQAL